MTELSCLVISNILEKQLRMWNPHRNSSHSICPTNNNIGSNLEIKEAVTLYERLTDLTGNKSTNSYYFRKSRHHDFACRHSIPGSDS
jgi:hypothetical protein